MSGLLRNLLGHVATRFQSSSPTSTGITAIAPADDSSPPRIEEPDSASELLIACLRGYEPRSGLPEVGLRGGRASYEADLRFEMTMVATRLF